MVDQSNDADNLVAQLTRKHHITPKQLAYIMWVLAVTLSPTLPESGEGFIWLRVFNNLDADAQEDYVRRVTRKYPQAVVEYVGRQ